MTDLLVDCEADVNFQDNFQQTPLFTACMCDNFYAAKTLLENGINKLTNYNVSNDFDCILHWQVLTIHALTSMVKPHLTTSEITRNGCTVDTSLKIL